MISQPLIEKVLSLAQTHASHSWEYSTVFSALLEYHNPSLTVFASPFLSNTIPTLSINKVPALSYIQPHILTNATTLCHGNGSSADPASLGIPALLLSKALVQTIYFDAATRQLNHLLHTVPRSPNGAISHRESSASLWADYVYMVPPFLTYYGVVIDDLGMVREGVRQCVLYCEVLDAGSGVWRHIVNPTRSSPGEDGEEVGEVQKERDDPGLWSTSNGWAAAGMARVLATLLKSKFARDTENEQTSLLQMIQRIIDGAMNLDTQSSGLLRNYLNDETWWGEVSGTALLAATVFRMVVLQPDIFSARYTEWAVRKMKVVGRCIDEETGSVSPVVNPLNEGQKTPLDGISPEGQAFVVLIFAAWRDWKAANDQDVK